MIRKASSRSTVLVASEDVGFCLLLDHIFELEGFNSVHAATLEETLRVAQELKPDAILVDCKPDSFPGRQTCSSLKADDEAKRIPVIALLEPGAERDHVHLSKTGVEASFSKPIVPANLLEHLRALLGGGQAALTEDVVTYADVEMNTMTYQVYRDGRRVHLSPTEFKLLRYFMQKPERVITRDELKGAAWRATVHVGPRTIDVHVGRLRRALKASSSNDLIRTVRSVGYALSERELAEAGQSAQPAER